MKFTLEGMDEAFASLGRIASAVVDDNLQEDGLEALEPVVEDAQALAPVDRGDLRDSIKAVVFDDGGVGVVIENWKGHFFEFGTVTMRAQPMLGPAWLTHEDAIVQTFGGRVGARIDQAV